MIVPQLAYGPGSGYVIYFDCYRVAALGVVDARWVTTAFQAAWSLLDGLGLFHLTTVWPGNPRPPFAPVGLRPGECVRGEVVEDGTLFGTGGKSPQNQHRNPSLWLPCETMVLCRRADPVGTGINFVHEVGHTLLPPAGPWGNLSAHDDRNPRNVMWRGTLSLPLSWTPEQTAGWVWGLDRLRVQGLRWTEAGDAVRVSDGGRPAWPPG